MLLRSGQGMVDALKPKLKFDSAGMGLNRLEDSFVFVERGEGGFLFLKTICKQ